MNLKLTTFDSHAKDFTFMLDSWTDIRVYREKVGVHEHCVCWKLDCAGGTFTRRFGGRAPGDDLDIARARQLATDIAIVWDSGCYDDLAKELW